MPSRSSRAHVHQSPVRAGPKASLLAGGDGRALQQLTLQVPANRLHLVSVDTQGVARLKLRPRFEMDGDLGVVRIDAAPRYGTPPTVEDLYRAAARNHELERTYDAERRAQRTTRRDTDLERRERVAQAFTAIRDSGPSRILPHPSGESSPTSSGVAFVNAARMSKVRRCASPPVGCRGDRRSMA